MSVEYFEYNEVDYLKSTLQKVLKMPITQLAQDIITELKLIFHMLK